MKITYFKNVIINQIVIDFYGNIYEILKRLFVIPVTFGWISPQQWFDKTPQIEVPRITYLFFNEIFHRVKEKNRKNREVQTVNSLVFPGLNR